jgi:hypothetical protein
MVTRQRRQSGYALREGHRLGHSLTVGDDLLNQPPLVRLRRADSIGGQDHGLLGARQPHQRQQARQRAPAHVHAERHLGDAEVGARAAKAEIERDGQRHAAADAGPLDGRNRDLLHVPPGAAHARADPQRGAPLAKPELGPRAASSLRSKPAEKARALPVRTTTEVAVSSSNDCAAARS